MRIKSTMLLAFLGCVGCGGTGTSAPPNAPSSPVVSMRATSGAEVPQPPAAEPSPAATLAEADRAFDAQLGVSRGDHFDVDRQVAVLRQAVLLYTQFLERAEGRPELEPAVRKSRERIADANQTIEFLLSTLSAGAAR